MADMDRRPWMDGDKRCLAECLIRAELEAPTPEFRFGKVADIKALHRDCINKSARFCYRSQKNLKIRLCALRREFDEFVSIVPKDIKEANDSRLLIKWILDNCYPYPDERKLPLDDGMYDRGDKEWDVRWEVAGNLWQVSQSSSDSGYDKERIIQELLVELRCMTREVEEDLERYRKAGDESERNVEDNPYTIHPVRPTPDDDSDDFDNFDDPGRHWRRWQQQEKACHCNDPR
ncbi:hypothetical protein PG996_007938 [Apiospora saccharicola]|uniref:Uncharacterized protein n=1 Tax=Apiospora saccharicola TaxID=335842 RepID=A0ABR1UWH7_9PEZI